MSEKTTTIERRTLLTIISALGLAVVTPYAWSAASSLRLVLVHGRGQQGLDPIKLKTEWLNALSKGAQGNGRSLARDVEIAFPYYGDVLEKFTREADIPLTSDVKSRGGGTDDDFLVFQAEVAEAVRQRAGVTDTQVDLEYGANPKPKGPLNWEWVQAILRALDKHGGGINQAALETFTRDVYLYVTKAGVRDEIDRIVGDSITEQPTIVVGHSLGSVVAYNVLRSDRRSLRVPLFLTVGCPLGIRAIRDQFRPLRFPTPVNAWYNAFDTRDVVALFPLDKANFPVIPEIENYSSVINRTDDRHGIAGYLDDPTVAKKLLDSLI